MVFENSDSNPLLAILPPLLHVRRTGQGAQPWLGLSTQYVVSELDSRKAGATEVVTRLADILFVQAVRSYFEENANAATSGWLAAARDRQIGPALAILHSQPHSPWTIESLARRVAMSRSALAARFKELVGEPPQQYLTRLRINVAAGHLRTSGDKLSKVAAAAGYESAAAFAKAFKRHTGMTPGDYRKFRDPGRPPE
jgi:transcriptional regulator GlxA family with amidase domain